MNRVNVRHYSVRQVIHKVADFAFTGWLAFCLYRIFTFCLGTTHTANDTIIMVGVIFILITIIRSTADDSAKSEDEIDGYGNTEKKDDYDLCN